MTFKIVLVTGANTGIGLEIVKALYKSSSKYQIILSARNLRNAEEAVKLVQWEAPTSHSTVTAIQLDVIDDESIKAAFEKIDKDFTHSLDVLINNAGASFDLPIQKGQMTTREGWAASWDVNVTGAHIVTETFMPLLIESSDPRLIFLTSGTASLKETELNPEHPINKSPPKGWPKPEMRSIMSYRSTKVGLNMVMREWARTLRNDRVKVFGVAPGFLATNLGNEGPETLKKLGAGDPALGGECIRKIVEGERDADAGFLVRNYGTPIQPW